MGETFINVFFNGKERKLKAFVMRNAQNLFGIDWMDEFDLFNIPINTFCNKIDSTTTSSEKLKKRTKNKISRNIFRMTWILFIKENVMPFFD